jgi:hypothetical protein
MAQSLTPELYLLLLSGQCGSTSHVSTERRHNHIASRISGHPFPNDRDQLMDLLDALAAVCIHKDKAEVFFVSLAMDSEAVTLHVSSNTMAPATVTSHLTRIWGKLRMLQAVVEFDPPIPADSETSLTQITPSHVQTASLSFRRSFMSIHSANSADAF